MLVCVLPWTTRSQTENGIFTLSEVGTADFYFYNAKAKQPAFLPAE
jgi:hypothetical protein